MGESLLKTLIRPGLIQPGLIRRAWRNRLDLAGRSALELLKEGFSILEACEGGL